MKTKTALDYLQDGYAAINPEPAAPDETEELPVDDVNNDKPAIVAEELPLFVRLSQGFAELGFKGGEGIGN